MYVFFFLLIMEMRQLLSIDIHRKDLETLACSESDCESPGKYLFKDLDGRTLGLPPPVSVFPKTEAEWTGSFFNTGQLVLCELDNSSRESVNRTEMVWLCGPGEQNILEKDWAVELESVPMSCPAHLYLRNEVKWKSLSHVWLFMTPWTIQSMKFSRPKYWRGEPFPSPGDLPNPGIEPRTPSLQADSLSSEPPGKNFIRIRQTNRR